MPVPFEALLPLGVISAMFMTAGTLIGAIQRTRSLGKDPRRGLDEWDRTMMMRNERMTGHKYGQSDDVKAPATFATQNPVFLRRLG
ncbi:hypothetical protein RI367_000820 [Sorochytrium milnesiophthora]